MTFHRPASWFTPLITIIIAATAAFMALMALPALAASGPVALRVFYSSNLEGQTMPCG